MIGVGFAPRAQRAFVGLGHSALVVLAVTGLAALGSRQARAAGDTPHAASALYLAVEGTVSVRGASTERLPVRYKGELIADARGVPLMRGGRASVYDGRFDINLFGVIPDTCLSSNSLKPVFGSSTSRKEGGVLRVIKRRKVVMDLDALVGPELAGYDCRSGDRPLGETVSLRFTGTLGKAGLASVPLTATSPVKLAGGKRGTLKVTARATIRRLRKP